MKLSGDGMSVWVHDCLSGHMHDLSTKYIGLFAK